MTIKKITTFLLLSALMTGIFYSKIINKRNSELTSLGLDSQSLVLGKILADKNSIDTNKYGLGYFVSGKYEYTSAKVMESYSIIKPQTTFITDNNWKNGLSKHWPGFYDKNTIDNLAIYEKGRKVELPNGDVRTIENIVVFTDTLQIHLSGDKIPLNTNIYPTDFKVIDSSSKKYITRFTFMPYTSQAGIQGYFFEFLYNYLNIETTDGLRLINTFLLASVLTILCMCIYYEYNFIMSVVFYIVFATSPWINAFSGNLYWVPFTWFLPAVFSMLLLRNQKRAVIYLPLIFLSVLIKSLCGYEYLSTILIFAISFWIVKLFSSTFNKSKRLLFFIFAISTVSILGFATALTIHANLRSNNLSSGLKKIWTQDVLRRTYASDTENFNPVYKESLMATPMQVIKKYFNWSTPIIFGVNGNYFRLLFFGSIVVQSISLIRIQRSAFINSFLFLIFLSGTLSWFVLAKAHSYIHTHINFVMWYFGLIQIMFYILLKFIFNLVNIPTEWKKNTTT